MQTWSTLSVGGGQSRTHSHFWALLKTTNLEHIPIFRALHETTDPHHKMDLLNSKMRTRSTLRWGGSGKHPRFLGSTRDDQSAPQNGLCSRTKMRTRSTLREGGGSNQEHIPVFTALLETTDPHHKTDLVHAKTRVAGLHHYT